MDGFAENINKSALRRLLDQRYGDGQIYLTDVKERIVLKAAVHMGLVSAEGYLTQSGRRFWANHALRETATP
ncbi:MAG: hypothetical protein ACREV4_03950 [Gammaproteobacteria bacterium]